MAVNSSNIANMATLEQSKAICERTLTKREQIAAMAMQGILSNSGVMTEFKSAHAVRYAVLLADALIEELDKVGLTNG
ncbi:hypothetical protein [Psychrobacter pygoscelis]|uniref:hypothetical protein n=1 Tax=Psychrobacter pygoscelis TaxID=2488563 RepID=UPI00103C5AB4|nr:hypothetical protein [Psychrobacter pygoscelis]